MVGIPSLPGNSQPGSLPALGPFDPRRLLSVGMESTCHKWLPQGCKVESTLNTPREGSIVIRMLGRLALLLLAACAYACTPSCDSSCAPGVVSPCAVDAARFPTNDALLERIRHNIDKKPAQAWFHWMLR